jgi:hypothetical protein
VSGSREELQAWPFNDWRLFPYRSPIRSAPWGRYATFSDPDGNGWVLQEARGGA